MCDIVMNNVSFSAVAESIYYKVVVIEGETVYLEIKDTCEKVTRILLLNNLRSPF